MGCKMTKAKKQRAKPSKRDDEASIDLGQVDIMTLDRKQLQKLCKERGIKANGKTTELQEKLKSYKPGDVNNNITEDHSEVYGDQKMKEQISLSDEHLDQTSDTAKACHVHKMSKTTKDKKLGKQDASLVGEKDEDERKGRKKGRGKGRSEKKPRRNKTGKDLTKEDVVTKCDDHLVDDDSFVIEKICKYDEVSKYDDDDDGDVAHLQRGRRNITRAETVKQNADQDQVDKASSFINDTLIKNTKANEKKNPEMSGENEAGSLEDDKAEDSRTAKVKANRKYLRGKKENKVEKSLANSLQEEKKLEGKTSKKKSKNEVNTDGQAQYQDKSDNVRTGEGRDKKKKKGPAVKKANNRQVDTKKAPVSPINKSLGSTKPDDQERADVDNNDSDVQASAYFVDVTGCTSDFGSFYDNEERKLPTETSKARSQTQISSAKPVFVDDDKERANEEDNASDEARDYFVDITGCTSDFGSFYDNEENQLTSGTRSQIQMSSTRDCSYYLKTIELEQSCLTEKEYDSTFPVENGDKQTEENDGSFTDFSGYELPDDSCSQAEEESKLSLTVRRDGHIEGNFLEHERDSTFTVKEKDPHERKQTESVGNASLMERGSSVSSTEDGDLKNHVSGNNDCRKNKEMRLIHRLGTLNPNESQGIQSKQPVTSCTRWCVVEGIQKHSSEISWKRIKLKGGRPIVPNRFGKYILFVLEPSNIEVPCDFRDNYICGSCVRDNERLNGERCNTTVALATRKQQLASQRNDSQNDDEYSETPLSIFTRGDGIRASVKRKRVEDHSTSKENQDEVENQPMLTKRQRNSLSTSNRGIPASPVIRKARGEKLKLPRNHKKAWRPKKSSRSSSPLNVAEDASFAQKVEAIIKTTVPGSEEELNMIMSKNCRVQRSPTKN